MVVQPFGGPWYLVAGMGGLVKHGKWQGWGWKNYGGLLYNSVSSNVVCSPYLLSLFLFTSMTHGARTTAAMASHPFCHYAPDTIQSSYHVVFGCPIHQHQRTRLLQGGNTWEELDRPTQIRVGINKYEDGVHAFLSLPFQFPDLGETPSRSSRSHSFHPHIPLARTSFLLDLRGKPGYLDWALEPVSTLAASVP